jgi:hypothetical protein
MAKASFGRSKTISMKRAQRHVRSDAYSDATRMLWGALTQKLVIHVRRFHLEYFHASLGELRSGRSDNIRNQWVVYSNELQDRLRVSNMRELWRSFAFLLQKQVVRSAMRTLVLRGGWRRLSRALVLQNRLLPAARRPTALSRLGRFFRRILVPFRCRQAVACVESVDCDYGHIVHDSLELSCRRINQCAKLWLARKARRFAVAYADEIFGTALVHIAGKLGDATQL